MLSAPYLIVFIAGLCIAVYAMLQGVTAAPTVAKGTRVARRATLSVAPFAIAFGAIGYLMTRHSSDSPWITLAASAIGAALTIFFSAPLLARLARKSVQSEPELEGQLAKVITTLSSSQAGEIGYQRDGESFRQPALNVADAVFQPGKEVVIDRVENGIAYVEDWESVERRL